MEKEELERKKLVMIRLRQRMRSIYPRLIEARRKVAEIETFYTDLCDRYEKLNREVTLVEKRKVLPPKGKPRKRASKGEKTLLLAQKIKGLLKEGKAQEAQALLQEALR